jgi:hypothetical protein
VSAERSITTSGPGRLLSSLGRMPSGSHHEAAGGEMRRTTRGFAVRYALIASIRTPKSRQDIYHEATTRIPALQRARIRLLEPYLIQPVLVRS